jgi:hypothetical protein
VGFGAAFCFWSSGELWFWLFLGSLGFGEFVEYCRHGASARTGNVPNGVDRETIEGRNVLLIRAVWERRDRRASWLDWRMYLDMVGGGAIGERRIGRREGESNRWHPPQS